MTLLRFTRYLISLATTVHLKGLTFAISRSAATVAKAVRQSDTDCTAYGKAHELACLANNRHTESVKAENAAVKAHRTFTNAASIEAKQVRRGYAIAA